MNRIEHRADVIVGRDPLHPEQRLTVRRLAPVLERALIRQDDSDCIEQRKGRQADSRHRIDARFLPLVGKAGTNILQASQKSIENQHLDLESEPRPARNRHSNSPRSLLTGHPRPVALQTHPKSDAILQLRLSRIENCCSAAEHVDAAIKAAKKPAVE